MNAFDFIRANCANEIFKCVDIDLISRMAPLRIVSKLIHFIKSLDTFKIVRGDRPYIFVVHHIQCNLCLTPNFNECFLAVIPYKFLAKFCENVIKQIDERFKQIWLP